MLKKFKLCLVLLKRSLISEANVGRGKNLFSIYPMSIKIFRLACAETEQAKP